MSDFLFYDPMDYSPPGSSVLGISQARILGWGAISYSRGSCRPRDRTWVSYIINGGLKHWKTLNVIFCSLILQLKVKVKITQVCPILCDPMNYSPPGSSVHGILQARRLEWVAMPSSRGIFQTQGLNLGLLQSEPSGKGGQLNLICNEELKLIRKREREKKKNQTVGTPKSKGAFYNTKY